MTAPTPLAGLTVVEFTHMVMGPTCGMVLADLGAEVVKVEPAPAGDTTRALTGSGTGFYAACQRNRRSLCVDIKTPEGMALVRKLLAGADVVVENFRPGAMDKLGLGWEALHAAHPRLIYCSCKGFLPGPYDHRTALDEVVQMMGGLAYMTGLPGRPLRAGSSVIDIMGGMAAAIGILAAVAERATTGVGRHVQSGLFETVAMLMGQHMAQTAITGSEPPPMSNRLPAWPVYDVFDTADGGQLFVGVVTDTQWPLFCDEFGLDDLKADPSLATKQQRVAERHRTIPRVAEALGRFTKAELAARMEQLGLPFAPIGRPAELFEDPHLNGSGGERLPLRRDLVAPGADNAAIAAELGYDAAGIAALREKGVLAG